MDELIKRIIEDCGGQTAFAERLSERLAERGEPPITRQAIAQWKKVPVERAKDIAAITGRALHELRPDIWDAPPPSATEPGKAADALHSGV